MSERIDGAVGHMTVAGLASHIEHGDALVLDLVTDSGSDEIFSAVRYRPEHLEVDEEVVLPLPRDSGLIVCYDEDGGERAERIARKLARDGYGSMCVLEGGFVAWKAAGGKLQERGLEQPIT